MEKISRWVRYPETIVIAFIVISCTGAFFETNTLVVAGYAFVAIWISILFMQKFWISRTIQNRFGGRIVSVVETPTPSTSMLSSLRMQGQNPDDLDAVDLMTYDLEAACNYLNKEGSAFRKVVENSDVNVRVVGSGESCNHDFPQNISFHKARHTLEEHVNLIKTRDGSKYVWFEPKHVVNEDSHSLPSGAYLVQITDDDRWLDIEKQFESTFLN